MKKSKIRFNERLKAMGRDIGLKIPDLLHKNKIFPPLNELEKSILYIASDCWKYINLKGAETIERSKENETQCIYSIYSSHY
jgi:hypothetical protein